MSARSVDSPGFLPATRPLNVDAAPKRTMAKPSGNRLMLTALFDQGAVSCGNFLTNILLARSLAADQYGVFALFLDAILFLNSLQAALLIYPLTVRCPLLDDRQLRRCAGTCVLLTLLIAIPLGLALAGYGMFIGAGSVALWAVLGQTFWQCQETLRRTMLARRSYSRAILGDCVSYLGQVIIIALLVMGNKADVPRAFMAMAITSLIAAIIQGFQIGLLPTAPRAAMEMGKSFWFIGRWVMVSNLTNVLTSVCCTFTLARSHHNAAVGQYAAVSNLLRIANPLFITLATLIVPAVALAAAGGHNHRTLSAAWRVSRHYGVRGAALLVPYWLVLMVFPGKALAIFYHGRPEYLGLETDLRLFVCISIFTMINAVVASFFNGLHRSRRAMVAQFVGAGACVVVTIPLTIKFGLEGLLVGTLLSNAVIAMALVYLYHLLSREFADTSESPSLTSATSPPVAAPVV